ncbi:MAG: hypothetical protein HC882_04405, partial [Acidobacteria bacterium]|nr:hypothetical protein [Acidobacteriota bacterium]
MIVLYQYPGIARGATLSPPCAKVQMALAYKALAYRVHDCSTPMEVKRVNPRGRVPALRIDDAIVVDSSDILSHLDVIQPAPPLMPDSQQDQAMAQVLEDWADEALYFYGLYLRWCTPDGFARMKSVVLSKMPFPVRLIVPVIARRETAKRSRAQGVGLKDARRSCGNSVRRWMRS